MPTPWKAFTVRAAGSRKSGREPKTGCPYTQYLYDRGRISSPRSFKSLVDKKLPVTGENFRKENAGDEDLRPAASPARSRWATDPQPVVKPRST